MKTLLGVTPRPSADNSGVNGVSCFVRATAVPQRGDMTMFSKTKIALSAAIVLSTAFGGRLRPSPGTMWATNTRILWAAGTDSICILIRCKTRKRTFGLFADGSGAYA